MIDLHQGTSRNEPQSGSDLSGAGASVLTIVTEQTEVFADLWNLRLVSAARRQARLNARLARIALDRALGR